MRKETKISEVQIKIVKPNEGLIGFASLVLNDFLYLSSIGIYTLIDGSGYRLTYPTKKLGETNINIFHPVTSELGRQIEEAIFSKLSEINSDSSNNLVAERRCKKCLNEIYQQA